MIVFVTIRVSNVRAGDFQVWAAFWLQIEGCTAILTVSLTAFRTLFFSDHIGPGPRKKTRTTDSSRRFLQLRRTQAAEGHDRAKLLVAIPSATLTGMRTLIRGGQREPMLATDHTDESNNGTIQVTHDVSVDRESISKTESDLC